MTVTLISGAAGLFTMADDGYTPGGISPDYTPDGILPDHAVAWCAWMREQIKRVEGGQAVHEVCGDMILPVTFGARRI